MNSSMLKSAISQMVGFVGIVVVSSTLQAASFDCTKAGTSVEKIICSNPAASSLDEQLNAVYKSAIDKSLDKESLKRQQRTWLKNSRNVCSNVDCVIAAYSDRISYFQHSKSLPETSEILVNTDIELLPNSVSEVEITKNPGICTDSHSCNIRVIAELMGFIENKISVKGDYELCMGFLKKPFGYYKFSEEKTFKKKVIDSGDWSQNISPGYLFIDIDNDGKNEPLIEIKIHSGAGSGCDQEYLQVPNYGFDEISDNSLNEILLTNSCRYYSRPFSFAGKNYIENRAARKNYKELGFPEGVIDSLFVELLSDVYLIEDGKLNSVCSYTY
ncbi:MAG: hypothetical protein B0W54_03970 [Cellvibrio sp. 79]|nr:MAG: hypothetical protein B0W54_03970 [Cellvibrio sp. 79]